MENIIKKYKELEQALNYVCYNDEQISKLSDVWQKLFALKKALNIENDEVETVPKKSWEDFSIDMEKWEETFICNECGCDGHLNFRYVRTVANGEVWQCKNCSQEILVDDKPDEYKY